MSAPLPQNELERLAALVRYDVLDTPPEQSFDRLTRTAAYIFGTPTALVSLVDRERQWFKSCFGLDMTETPRNVAFCAHAILGKEPLVVCDATQDARFAKLSIVTGKPYIRFYAGAPLVTSDGFRIGSLCVVDSVARSAPTSAQLSCLADLADQVVEQLELRKAARELDALRLRLVAHETQLSAAHRMLRAALESTKDHVLIFDHAGVITYASRTAIERLTGGRNPVGHTLRDVLDGPESASLNEACRSAEETGVTRRTELFYPPLHAWFDVHAFPTEDGVAMFLRDVTEARLAQHALTESEQRLSLALEAAGLGMWDSNLQTGVGHYSEAYAKMLGYEPGSFPPGVDM